MILLFSGSGFLGLGFLFAGVTIKLKETAQLRVNGLQFFCFIFSAQFSRSPSCRSPCATT